MNRVTEARFDQHRRPSSTKPTFPPTRSSGGRTWWAHFEFTRINIEPIILRKKIEDVREAGALTSIAASGVSRSCLSPVRLSFSGRWFEKHAVARDRNIGALTAVEAAGCPLS
jgi:hypothetical protein